MGKRSDVAAHDGAVHATGMHSAPIFIVGEAPGREELAQGEPFVGPSGRILWTAAAAGGIRRDSCYVTNVVMAAPQGKTGAPSASQINAEWDRLDAELAASAATIVICVGGIALKRVTGLSNITNARGYLIRPDECLPCTRPMRVQVGVYATSRRCPGCKGDAGHACHQCNGYAYQKGDPKYAMRKVSVPRVLPSSCKYIIPVLHPAGIMRMQFRTIAALRADLERAGRAVRGELQVISPRTVQIDDMPQALQGLMVAVDIETPQPPNDGLIERIGFATPEKAWSAPWDVARPVVAEQFAAWGTPIAFHNAAFDLPRLEAAGVLNLDGCGDALWDTMYAAQLLNPDLPKGLERAATMLLDLERWKHLNEEDPRIYNGLDALITARLASAQMVHVERTGQTRVFRGMMRALPALIRLQQRGIRVDPVRLGEWQEELRQEQRQLLAEWPEPAVNPMSSRQLAVYLYTTLGLEAQYTKDGGWTTDAGALALLLRETEDPRTRRVLELVSELRRVNMDLKTYADVELSDMHVHPHYLPADKDEASTDFTRKGQGAGTGRPIARDPNIQNQHVRARRIYVPRKGWCLATGDWSQAELRYDAARSSDLELARAIDAPGGVPAVVIAAIVAAGQAEIDRVRAKNLIYGGRNGAGKRKIARVYREHGYNVSEDTVQQQLDAMWRRFPRFAARRLALMQQGASQRYITNAFGRRRQFYVANDGPRMVGFDAQSGVADMLYDVLPDLHAVTWLLALVHDSVVFQAPPEQIEADAKAVKEIMEREFPQVAPGFRVPVSIKIGLPDESWGDMELRYEGKEK